MGVVVLQAISVQRQVEVLGRKNRVRCSPCLLIPVLALAVLFTLSLHNIHSSWSSETTLLVQSTASEGLFMQVSESGSLPDDISRIAERQQLESIRKAALDKSKPDMFYVSFGDPNESPLFHSAFLDSRIRPNIPVVRHGGKLQLSGKRHRCIRLVLIGVLNPPLGVGPLVDTTRLPYSCLVWQSLDRTDPRPPPHAQVFPLLFNTYGNGLHHGKVRREYYDQGHFFCELPEHYGLLENLRVTVVNTTAMQMLEPLWGEELEGTVTPSNVKLASSLAVVPRAPQQVQVQVPFQKGICGCLSHLFGDRTTGAFVEWVEWNLLMGVEHLDVYFDHGDVGPWLRTVMALYASKGVLTAHERIMPRVANRTIAYRGQVTNNMHCLYNRMHTCQHLLFMDVDEYLVPAKHQDFKSMIASLPPSIHKMFPSYMFPRNCQNKSTSPHRACDLEIDAQRRFHPGFYSSNRRHQMRITTRAF
mmetsp:Transcript_33794/g.56753  ORF Transcript_33794/g.56753 Transcript_33794/m.56753 type:complete len:473 (+) Transcript_33794:416-1834(+)